MTPSLWALAAVAVAAAFFDLRERRIPNWLTLPALALGFALGHSLDSLLGLGLALLVYLPLFLLRANGAGDLKLMAALGAILGWRDWLLLFVLTALCGGVLAVAISVLRGRLSRTLANTATILGELIRGRAPHRASPELDVTSEAGLRLPHAVSIAAGALLLIAGRVL